MADHIDRAAIKRMRLAKKYSLRQAAILAGIHEQFGAQRWKGIEDGTGDLQVLTVVRVARALGCGVEDIVRVTL